MRKVADPLAPVIAAFFRPERVPRPAGDAPLLDRGARQVFACGLVGWTYGHGPTVLLVHGWQGRGAQLGGFVDPLVRSGRRAVLLDGPAHGDSPGVETNPLGWAALLGAVGAEIGAVEAVVAHSLGAMATVLAVDSGLDVQKLALLSMPKSMVPRREAVERLAGLSGRRAQRFRREVEARVGVPLESLDLDTPRSLYRSVRALLVHGLDDEEVDVQEAVDVLRSWPLARLIQGTGLGHNAPLYDSVVIGAAVAFLDSGAPGRCPRAMSPGYEST